MSNIQIFGRALLAGLIVSAPIGPVGVVSVRYAILRKGVSRLAAALGMITGDFVYTCLINLDEGFAKIFEREVLSHHMFIHIIIGILVCLLGLKIFFTRHIENKTEKRITQSQHVYFTTFTLTVFNPLNLLGFIVILTVLGVINASFTLANRLMVIGGMTCGIILWWPLILKWINFLQQKQKKFNYVFINKITGSILIIIGIYYLFNKFLW
jgi:threonine/homoserine/homoserine lactone efflux protein